MSWKYFIPDWGETKIGADVIFDFRYGNDNEDCASMMAAEAAAQYIHDNRDGWESQWPMDIGVISPKGKVFMFEIDREYIPSFFSTGKPKIL